MRSMLWGPHDELQQSLHGVSGGYSSAHMPGHLRAFLNENMTTISQLTTRNWIGSTFWQFDRASCFHIKLPAMK